MKVILSLGSNIGNKKTNLMRAVESLSKIEGVKQMIVSNIYESEPWGFDSSNIFLNMVVELMFEKEVNPIELLKMTQDVEKNICGDMHRGKNGNYVDRIIDIDIVAIDDRVINLPRLKVPHPLMHKREFVLRPMSDVEPEWCHPIFHLTVPQMLNKLR